VADLADPLAGAGRPCPSCGLVLAPSLLACGACGALVYATELRALAEDAELAGSQGRNADAIAAWRAALPLLPPNTRQHAAIVSKLEALVRAAPPTVAAPRRGIGGGLAAAGTLALILLSKGKFLLLGLTKLPTLLSMFVYFGASWAMWGWPFALGLVLSIYVHEMGHVAALRQLGIRASAPMFVPGLGAFVRLKQYPASSAEDARVGLAGPLWGLGAALVSAALFLFTGAGLFAAVAKSGAWINLFNLLPVGSLDGGRGFRALAGRERWLVAALLGALFVVTSEGLLLVIAAVAAWRAGWGERPEASDARAFRSYVVLAVTLALLAGMPVPGRP
jgi:Zn-dependent protease